MRWRHHNRHLYSQVRLQLDMGSILHILQYLHQGGSSQMRNSRTRCSQCHYMSGKLDSNPRHNTGKGLQFYPQNMCKDYDQDQLNPSCMHHRDRRYIDNPLVRNIRNTYRRTLQYRKYSHLHRSQRRIHNNFQVSCHR